MSSCLIRKGINGSIICKIDDNRITKYSGGTFCSVDGERIQRGTNGLPVARVSHNHIYIGTEPICRIDGNTIYDHGAKVLARIKDKDVTKDGRLLFSVHDGRASKLMLTLVYLVFYENLLDRKPKKQSTLKKAAVTSIASLKSESNTEAPRQLSYQEWKEEEEKRLKKEYKYYGVPFKKLPLKEKVKMVLCGLFLLASLYCIYDELTAFFSG